MLLLQERWGDAVAILKAATQEAALILVATVVKVPEALEPSVVIDAMHATMIRAIITAYSTAVGPLSSLRKRTVELHSLVSMGSFLIRFVVAVLFKGREVGSDRGEMPNLRTC